MNSIGISLIALACSMGGAWGGVWIRKRLPDGHMSDETAEVVKLGTGLIGTMAALVLGLLVASAAAEFNSEATGLQTLSTNFIVLDRALRHYGPEAAIARQRLHGVVEQILSHAESKDRAILLGDKTSRVAAEGSLLFDAIRDLSPETTVQKTIQSQCVQICVDIGKTRWALVEGADNPIPTLFLAVLMFWLTALFMGFGLLSPSNATVVAVLFVCSVSVAAALLIILDLNEPFEGLIHVSIDPVRHALAELS